MSVYVNISRVEGLVVPPCPNPPCNSRTSTPYPLSTHTPAHTHAHVCMRRACSFGSGKKKEEKRQKKIQEVQGGGKLTGNHNISCEAAPHTRGGACVHGHVVVCVCVFCVYACVCTAYV